MKKMTLMVLVSLTIAAPAFADVDVRGACRSDVKSLCAGVQRGGGRIKQCMKDHKDQLSSECKRALIEKKREK